MHTLYLLRHAKSSWDDPTLRDEDRPLAPRGRRNAKRMGKHLAELGIEPQLVLCSPAVRTRQTLECVRRAFGSATTVEVDERLYGASRHELLERVRSLPEELATAMLIGHNPGLHDLALALASSGPELPRLAEKFPTGALATLTVPGWRELSAGDGVLAAFVVPRELV